MAKILIVDDSATEREYLKEILASTAHEIVVACDGAEAEKLVREQAVDLILLDVVMPNKNGFQVCRDLKRNPQYKHIPIILTTSKSGESDKFWGKRQGADAYIVKPYEPVDLLLAIKKHLGGSK